ncbi:MAG: hypothetical protein RLZZ312_1250 [Bacteroidota bacterium]|jgi:protein disulfide-isomerase
MRRLIFLLILLALSNGVFAQDLVWETNINKAIERSIKEQKPMFLFFTGSDWCGWCIRLQNEVFKTPEFTEWAKQKVVLVDLDFPRRTSQPDDIKAQNNSLQQIFQIQGFPSIRVANADVKEGKITFELLGGLGYQAGGPVTWIKSADEVLKLNKKVYAITTAETAKSAKPSKKSKPKIK